MSSNVNYLDFIAILIYFVFILVVGISVLFTSKRGTVVDYFLAGRFMTWLPIGASLFASNIGTEHFIGLAGSGAASGIAVGAFELNVNTLPEYMRKRFGRRRIQIYLASLSLLLYVLTKISVNLYSGSLYLKEALNWNKWLSVFILLSLTGIITLTGGLTAVIYTDTVQFFIMIIGATILTVMSVNKVGGFTKIYKEYGKSIKPVNALSSNASQALTSLSELIRSSTNNSFSVDDLSQLHNLPSYLKCRLPSPKAFKLLREIDDPYMPWLGFLLGQTPASIWYWCADQMMVQRTLAAKSLSHAQGAALFTGLIKQLPIFIIVLPGMICRILYPDLIGCLPGADCLKQCGESSGCTNQAYPKLVTEIMPSGLKGLLLAVMLAALVSDLTSIFNSASTLFTVDIYQRIRKQAQNVELMIVGRVFIVVLIGISVLWIPIIEQFQGSQLYIYIQSIAAYLTPPIAVIYLCAILWKGTNEKGAFIGLMYGLILGLISITLNVIYKEPICGEYDDRPWIVKSLHYMYFAMFSFGSTAIIVCLISLLTNRNRHEQTERLTYWSVWNNSAPHVGNTMSSSTKNVENALKLYYDSEVNNLVLRSAHDFDFSNNIEVKKIKPTWKHFISWICGMETQPCPGQTPVSCCCVSCCMQNQSPNDEHNQQLNEKRLVAITHLEQSKNVKIVLYIGFVFTLIMAIFGFVFYSTYFGNIRIGPLPILSNTVDRSHISSDVINYLNSTRLVTWVV